MLVSMLQRIPFQSAFDILFRHGAIASLEAVFPGRFLFLFLGRERNLWIEVVCALRLVQRLEHPAFALYLLHPADRSIPDSVGAWSVSARYSDAEWILPVRRDLLIRAMKVFLPVRESVYDWLDGADLVVTQSLDAWNAKALECIFAHRFTQRWWRTEALLWDGETMGAVILNAAEVEMARLKRALVHAECAKIIRLKLEKRETNSVEKKETKSLEKRETKSLEKKETKPLVKKRTEKPLKLSINEEQCARNDAERLLAEHKHVLGEVKSFFSARVSTFAFETHFLKIARIVMALAKRYPRIKWNLKAMVHDAATDRLGYTVWYVERSLCQQATCRLEDEPISALRAVC
jgi:hypothetical protein